MTDPCSSQVKRISLAKNILRALDANHDIPPLSAYPRSHQVRLSFGTGNSWMLHTNLLQVTYKYYLGMLDFLSEEYTKVRAGTPA